uniref:Damage-control phosphatase ARMT1-like metal-binding domain-containing protein n=1 Tax=Lotharella globosa TaxID=91324 RepID=A0A7S3Z817_9EUKA
MFNYFDKENIDKFERFEKRLKAVGVGYKHPAWGNDIGRKPSYEQRLNYSYLRSPTATQVFDEYTLKGLPLPRGFNDEVDFWAFKEDPIMNQKANKTMGDYAYTVWANLDAIYAPFLQAPYSEACQEQVRNLIEEVRDLDRKITPLKTNTKWNLFVHGLGYQRLRYRRAPIYFLENYVYQRLREILIETGEDPERDAYEEVKRKITEGSKDSFLEILDILPDLRADGANLDRLLRRSATAGRLDLFHNATYGKDQIVGKPQITYDEKHMYQLREETKRMEAEKEAYIQQKRAEHKAYKAQKIADAPEGKLIDINDEPDFDEDELQRLFPMHLVKQFNNEGLLQVRNRSIMPGSRFYSETSLDNVTMPVTYWGREEGKLYVGDMADQQHFGVPNCWTSCSYVTIFSRDDSTKAAEKLKDSNNLLMVMGHTGLECLTDLVLVDQYLQRGQGRKATLHLSTPNKQMSLCTASDIHAAVDFMAALDDHRAKGIATRLRHALEKGSLILKSPLFYNTPLPYWAAPQNFKAHMNQFDYVIVKSDWHYRRLTGDLEFFPCFAFSRLTSGILPNATLLALRTVNYPGSVVGLPYSAVNRARSHYKGYWDEIGIFAAIEMRYDWKASEQNRVFDTCNCV